MGRLIILNGDIERRFSSLVNDAFNSIMEEDLERLQKILVELEMLKSEYPTNEHDLIELSCFTEFPVYKSLELFVGDDHVSLYYESGYEFKGCRYLFKDHPTSMAFLKILLRYSPMVLIFEEPE
ncbi:MAG: hypothetical protein ACXQS8_03840 [Candidatus Helarchaeales archaeon]